LSVFLLVLFSKRSFAGSAQLILNSIECFGFQSEAFRDHSTIPSGSQFILKNNNLFLGIFFPMYLPVF
jgi:hypothetical protein